VHVCNKAVTQNNNWFPVVVFPSMNFMHSTALVVKQFSDGDLGLEMLTL
jgi:hypothetical protein